MNSSNVKITILGHPCSGKSTYALCISEMLKKHGVDVDLRDKEIYIPVGETTSHLKKRLRFLAKSLKNQDGRVIIETQQAKRREKIA